MKNILNHLNKENLNSINSHQSERKLAHPSQETAPKPFRPVIKVGYKIVESVEQESRRYKKPVMVLKQQPIDRCGVKKVAAVSHQGLSGVFIQSEYVPKHSEKQEARFHRKGVQQAHEKYQSGRQFSQELRRQFINKSRSSHSIATDRSSINTDRNMERQKLSGYKNEGIKDILQYQHAGHYREERVATKCNNQRIDERCLNYKDLHELDFRRNKHNMF